MLYHAWYSKKQLKHTGTVWVSRGGERKEATMVSEKLDHGCKWDDLEYLGEGWKWEGRATEGQLRLGQMFG